MAGPSDIADVLERLYEQGLGEFGAEKMAAALAVLSDERSLEDVQQIAQQGSRSDLSWAATVSSLCLRGELIGIRFLAHMLGKGQKSEPIRTDAYEVLAFKQLATVLKKFGKPYFDVSATGNIVLEGKTMFTREKG